MRSIVALAVTAVAMALGAVILGEYELTGATPFVAAALFGLALAELLGSVAGERTMALAVGALGLTMVGLVWAAWIQAGRDWSYVPGATWLSVPVGGLVAVAWLRSSARRGERTPSDPPPPPGD